jgi:hypothetical protein
MGGLALSVYPVQMTIFVGQLGIHVVALLLIGLAYLHQSRGRWWEDLVATALLLPALVKPTLAAPFFWIVCFVPVRVRPMLLIGGGYVALTVLAASFQGEGLMTLMKEWLGQRTEVEVFEGHANLHHWLASLGLDGWMLPASLVSLALLGAWTYYHRQADFFVLLGVAALVARLWTHHRLHDDLLLLAPMVALFRIATTAPRARDVDLIAGGLLVLTWVSLHVPTWVFYDLPEPLVTAVETSQAVLWVLVLVFLLGRGRADRARRSSSPLAQSRTRDA